MSASQRNDVRAIAVDPSLSEILRQQTLLVLEANHAPFDDVRDLAPAELLAVASIWRDAMAVLDTIGWLPTPGAATIDVALTSGTPPSYVACGETRPSPSSIALKIAMRWLRLTISPTSMRRSVADV